jgi:hypothetical protein
MKLVLEGSQHQGTKDTKKTFLRMEKGKTSWWAWCSWCLGDEDVKLK